MIAIFPLLFSKEAMKKGNATVNFSTDEITIIGSTIKLLFTSSGHYCLPLNQHISLAERLQKKG